MLAQTKLTKKEWEMVEIKVTPDKLEILEMMEQGYDNDKITCYKLQSLVSFLKLENTNEIDNYIYEQFFKKDVTKLISLLSSPENITFSHPTKSLKNKVKKSDMIRITHNTTNIISENTYEYILLQFIEKILLSKSVRRKSKSTEDWKFYYFTLYKIQQTFVPNTNKIILVFLSAIFEYLQPSIHINDFVYNAKLFIEKNDNLFRYKHLTLYEHQKKIISACKTYQASPKLILYIAPTGTGKTLTPILLSSAYKVIYVCAAKHVGLSLAKSAISIHKKIAFAYGCACPNDVRLHYFSAKEYTRNSKSGGIHRVDNSVGDKVEIIICDVLSYLPAMNYMLRFNESTSIISYFDEPTIFLDYPTHSSHEIIHKNWSENVIPNVILSSATLPKEEEIPETIRDFRSKFENAVIVNIVSYECSKSIPLINKDGYIALPHYDTEELADVKIMANHIIENPTILRYLDIGECVRFIQEFEKTDYCRERDDLSLASNIDHLDKVELMNIKIHYLHILKYINQETWEIVMRPLVLHRGLYIQPFIKPKSIGPGSSATSSYSSSHFTSEPIVRLSSISTETPQLQEKNKNKTINSYSNPLSNEFGIYITTKDAHTLNDGPTIFITNDIEKISQFYIIQSNIPSVVMDDISSKIDFNSQVLARIDILEKALDDINSKRLKSNTETTKIEKRMNQDSQADQESKTRGVEKLSSELNGLSSSLKSIHLPERYVPNKPSHIQHWIGDTKLNYTPFTSDIDEEIVERIMKLNISQIWKLLLLMGIGVFSNKHSSDEYTEIIKMLADNQQLYLIIASSDYIYGTNYQFCNCYISKNMVLTQEKVIQAIGRVGRNNLQQNYSIRFRSNEHIQKLFNPEELKQEAVNMNLLFQSDLSDI
jgi:hypothetical protein